MKLQLKQLKQTSFARTSKIIKNKKTETSNSAADREGDIDRERDSERDLVRPRLRPQMSSVKVEKWKMIKDGKRSAREIDKELFGRAEQKWQQVEEREKERQDETMKK